MLMRQVLFPSGSAFMLIRKWSQNNLSTTMENESKNLSLVKKELLQIQFQKENNSTVIWLWLVFALPYTGFKTRILHLCTCLKGLFF